jgi:hypothetical protein
MNRRRFLHVIGGSAAAVAASEAFLDVLAQPRVPREARLRELAELALGEAEKLGATYADLRITRNRALSVAARDRVLAEGGGGGPAVAAQAAAVGVAVALAAGEARPTTRARTRTASASGSSSTGHGASRRARSWRPTRCAA